MMRAACYIGCILQLINMMILPYLFDLEDTLISDFYWNVQILIAYNWLENNLPVVSNMISKIVKRFKHNRQ